MPSVGEQLRRAREAQHLDIYQVAEITKIKTDHIRALENGQYDTFSAPIYIRGFVRLYARVLKLDPARIGLDLETELSQHAKFREPPSLTGEPQTALDRLMLQLTKLNWRIALALAVVVLVLILAMTGFRQWNFRQRPDPLNRLGPGLHQSPGDPGEVLPLPR